MDENEKGKRKYYGKKSKWIGIIVFLFILCVVCISMKTFFAKDSGHESLPAYIEGETHPAEVVYTESELRDVLGISELYTVSYTYNSIVTVYDEDNKAKNDDEKNVCYYVSYEGTVKAGIDFNDIDIKIDDNNKVITFTLPQEEIKETTVNVGALDYIFTDDKYNTETVTQEAYQKCCDDLKEKAETESKIKNAAKENTKAAVEALITPWVQQTNENYKIVVN